MTPISILWRSLFEKKNSQKLSLSIRWSKISFSNLNIFLINQNHELLNSLVPQSKPFGNMGKASKKQQAKNKIV